MVGNLDALTTVFTEFYYWVIVVFMFLIHVGFCMYEVGASRRKNHLHTLMKNIMIIPLVTVTFFFFGWWIYWAFPDFPLFGGLDLESGATNLPWSENMAPIWMIVSLACSGRRFCYSHGQPRQSCRVRLLSGSAQVPSGYMPYSSVRYSGSLMRHGAGIMLAGWYASLAIMMPMHRVLFTPSLAVMLLVYWQCLAHVLANLPKMLTRAIFRHIIPGSSASASS